MNCPICGHKLSVSECSEAQSNYESALDLLAYDIRIAHGVDPITAIEMARKRLKAEVNVYGNNPKIPA